MMRFEPSYGEATPNNLKVASALADGFRGWTGMFRSAMVWTMAETDRWQGSDMTLVEVSYVQIDGGNMSDSSGDNLVARYAKRDGVRVAGDPDGLWLAWANKTKIERAENLRVEAATKALSEEEQAVEAVAAINAALNSLEAEGYDINSSFRSLYINKKGAISCNGHCKLTGQAELTRRAISLCASFGGDALIDEVAAIVGIGE